MEGIRRRTVQRRVTQRQTLRLTTDRPICRYRKRPPYWWQHPIYTTYEINVDHIVRSLAIAAVGVSMSLSVANLVNTGSLIAAQQLKNQPIEIVQEELETQLVRPCIDWYVSKKDSKVEREAKNTIDDIWAVKRITAPCVNTFCCKNGL